MANAATPSYVPINGKIHIKVKLTKHTGTATFNWDAKNCTDGFGYYKIGDGY